jgi:hypothetical protein
VCVHFQRNAINRSMRTFGHDWHHVATCGHVRQIGQCLAMSGKSGKRSGARLPDCRTCRGLRLSLRIVRAKLWRGKTETRLFGGRSDPAVPLV